MMFADQKKTLIATFDIPCTLPELTPFAIASPPPRAPVPAITPANTKATIPLPQTTIQQPTIPTMQAAIPLSPTAVNDDKPGIRKHIDPQHLPENYEMVCNFLDQNTAIHVNNPNTALFN